MNFSHDIQKRLEALAILQEEARLRGIEHAEREAKAKADTAEAHHKWFLAHLEKLDLPPIKLGNVS